MAGTTWASEILDKVYDALAIDSKPELNKKLSMEWAKKNRLTAILTGQMAGFKNRAFKKAGMYRTWDKDFFEEDSSFDAWTTFGNIQPVNTASRRRLEIGYFDGIVALEISEKHALAQGSDEVKLRDFTQTQIKRKKLHAEQQLNLAFAEGDGLQIEGGDTPVYNVKGYRTWLGDTLAGTVGGMAVSGNTPLQWLITDGDAGPNTDYADDRLERIQNHIANATVDIDGKEMSPDFGLTTRAEILAIRQTLEADKQIVLGYGMGTEDKGPIHLGQSTTKGVIIDGCHILYDETIASGTKRIWLMNHETMEINHRLETMIEMRKERAYGRQGKNFTVSFNTSCLLLIEHMRVNGLIKWT